MEPSRCHNYWIDGGKFVTSLLDKDDSYILRTDEGFEVFYLRRRVMTFNSLSAALDHLRSRQKQARERKKFAKRQDGILPGAHRPRGL